MGDNVNLASRLEGMTKQYRSRIVISEGTTGKLRTISSAANWTEIRVKGKHQPVVVYELMAPIEDRARRSDLLLASKTPGSVSAQNWRDAAGKFGELLACLPGRWPDANLPAARPGIHGNCARTRLGRRVRDEEQVALIRRSYRKSRELNVGVF